MSDELIRLKWTRDVSGYTIEEVAPQPIDPLASTIISGQRRPGRYVVGNGGGKENYCANFDDTTMLLDFLRMPSDEPGILSFVDRWGMPFGCWEPNSSVLASEILSYQMQFVRFGLRADFYGLQDIFSGPDEQSVGKFAVKFLVTATHSVRMVLEPQSPRQLMELQVLNRIATGFRIYECLGCKTIAIASPRARSPQTCSPRCRKRVQRKNS